MHGFIPMRNSANSKNLYIAWTSAVLLEGVKMRYRGMKMGWRGTLLLLVVLIMGSLGGSAATIKEEIEVSRENPFIAEFVVEEPGEIYACLLYTSPSPRD